MEVERACMFMIEDKVPFLVTIQDSVDEAMVDEILAGIKLSLR